MKQGRQLTVKRLLYFRLHHSKECFILCIITKEEGPAVEIILSHCHHDHHTSIHHEAFLMPISPQENQPAKKQNDKNGGTKRHVLLLLLLLLLLLVVCPLACDGRVL